MKTGAPSAYFLDTLVCPTCGKNYSPLSLQTYATCCNQPLLVKYELANSISKNVLDENNDTIWRYSKFLPLIKQDNLISLGEGMTPMLRLSNLAFQNNLFSLLLKDESFNPTGSFKARGMSVAVSKAKESGLDRLIVPTAGNAGGALAAYCAKANMKCIVVMPEHTPSTFKEECLLFGAELILVSGLINDCARRVEEIKMKKDYFDLSTFKEPYRLEGKKTMGYEIAEQLNWKLPGVIVYPAGGGTGLIGIWKAFQEMKQMGWITGPLPKMIAVQAANCAPLAASHDNPANWKDSFSYQSTIANGLAVPFPFGLDLMKKTISESGGCVLTVTEEEIMAGVKHVAKAEGILLSPEGAATWAALVKLLENKWVMPEEEILLLNTASGYKS